MMNQDQIKDRLDEWCQIDEEFAEFLETTQKVYWMFDEINVLNLIKSNFASIPIGNETTCIQVIYDTLSFESLKRTRYGTILIFEKYFIDREDLMDIWAEIDEHVRSIGRIMSVTEAYGYPKDSHPKLGLPYNLRFVMRECDSKISKV